MFKFTIREAILMTTIVAVLLMWWLERSQNAKHDARLTAIETKLQVFSGTYVVRPGTPPPTVMPTTTWVFPDAPPTTANGQPSIPTPTPQSPGSRAVPVSFTVFPASPITAPP